MIEILVVYILIITNIRYVGTVWCKSAIDSLAQMSRSSLMDANCFWYKKKRNVTRRSIGRRFCNSIKVWLCQHFFINCLRAAVTYTFSLLCFILHFKFFFSTLPPKKKKPLLLFTITIIITMIIGECEWSSERNPSPGHFALPLWYIEKANRFSV